MNMNERFAKVNDIDIKDLPKLGDILDILIDGIRHVEVIDMIYRHSSDDKEKALAAVTNTAWEKLNKAHCDLEDLFTWKAEVAA